jgi:hypothetical protein
MAKKMISMELYLPPNLWVAMSDLKFPGGVAVSRDIRLCLTPSAPHQELSCMSLYGEIASVCRRSCSTFLSYGSENIVISARGQESAGKHARSGVRSPLYPEPEQACLDRCEIRALPKIVQDTLKTTSTSRIRVSWTSWTASVFVCPFH